MNNSFVKTFLCSLELFICFSLPFFTGCSNTPQPDSISSENETLRDQTTALEKSMTWTNEIEGSVLSADIVHTDGIASGVKLTPKSVVAGGDESSVTPIYPYLPGFGSLDLSKLDADTEQFLNNFCTAVTKGSELGSNMAAGCEYSGLLFYTDLADEWNDMFDESYPLTQDSETTPTGTAESSQTTTPLFTSFLLGEPFISDQVFQIPVRFFAVSGTVDVWLFLIKETASWKVDQIQIQKWEKTNGKQ